MINKGSNLECTMSLAPTSRTESQLIAVKFVESYVANFQTLNADDYFSKNFYGCSISCMIKAKLYIP